MDYSLRIAAIVEGRQTIKQLTADVKLLRQEADRIKQLDVAGAFESPEAIRKLKEQRRISGDIVESVDKTIQLEKTSAEQTRKKLLHQIKLNSAIRLFERRQKQTFSTGARDLKQFAGAIEDIEGAFSFFKKEGDISGIKALSEELGRINEQQRETTRQTGLQQVSLGKVSDFQAAINKFKAAGLNTSKAQAALDKFAELAGTKKVGLSQTAEKLLQRRLRLLREESNELNKQAAIERQRNAARSKKIGGAVSSALIGGGFPLLFGQGGVAAVGGAAGGLAGGLLGGAFGFALSIVGTAIGDAIQKTLDFNKSLKELNVTFGSSGNGAKLFAKDIHEIKKSLGGTREEALDAAKAFAFFGDRRLTTQFAKVFGQDAALLQKGLAVRDPESLRAAVEAVTSINNELGKELANNVLNLGIEEARVKVLRTMIRLKKGTETPTETVRTGEFDRRGRRKTTTQDVISGTDIGQVIASADEQLRLLEAIFSRSSGGKADPTINLQKRLDIAKGRVLAEQELVGLQGTQSKVARLILEHENARTKIQETATAELKKYTDAEDQSLITQRETSELKAADLKFERKALEFAEASLARTKDIAKPLQDQLNAIKDKAAFEREYGELIMAGVVPAVAQQTVEINKQVKEIDRLKEKQSDELDFHILNLEALKAKAGTSELEAKIQEKINKLLERRLELEGKAKEAKDAARDAAKTDRDRLEDAIKAIQGQINTLMDPVNQLIALSNTLGNAFAESFKGIVSGSMSAREALANLFQRTADHFLDMAAQMIAAQIKMQAVNLFMSFFPSSFTPLPGSAPQMKPGAVVTPTGFQGQFDGFAANGGPVTGGKSYIVGERGPELFTPGVSGGITPNHALGGANVTVNVDASGSSVEGNADQASQLGKAIGIAVQQELVKQKRPGGLLAS